MEDIRVIREGNGNTYMHGCASSIHSVGAMLQRSSSTLHDANASLRVDKRQERDREEEEEEYCTYCTSKKEITRTMEQRREVR